MPAPFLSDMATFNTSQHLLSGFYMATKTVHARIREKCETCFDSFFRALRLAEARGVPGSYGHAVTVLHDKFSHFRLWVRHVGVFVEPQLSLDFRVRDVDEFKELFLDHLDVVICRLLQLIDLISEESSSDVGMSNDDLGDANRFMTWTPDELLLSITQSLNWLQRLSNSIQEAISGYLAVEVNSFNIQQYTEHQSVSENAIRDYYTQLIHEISPDLEGNELVNRLVNTMILRLKRILHRRSRQVEWSFPHVKEPSFQGPGSQPSPSHRVSSESMTQGDTSIPMVITAPGAAHQEASSMPGRIGTSDVLGNGDYWIDRTSAIPNTDATPDSHNEEGPFPYPPECSSTCREFKCPYCGLLLPGDMAEKAWREHVRLDLEPYICIFSDCNESLETYANEVEWISHMRSAHCTKWRCVAPHADGKSFIAVTSQDFKVHMTEAHPGKHSDDELSLISSISRTVVPPTFDRCPFCSDHTITPELIEKHVAGHLRQFASRSLDVPTLAVTRRVEHTDNFEGAGTPREMETKLVPLKRPGRGMNATTPQSHGRLEKHSRRQPGRSNMDDETEQNEDRERKRSNEDDVDNKTLACPYFKKDRRIYGSCCGRKLSRIRDVKQHLKRRHYLPIYCAFCNEVFADEKVRDEHTIRRDCVMGTWPKPEGVSMFQQQELNRRRNRQLSEDEQWHEIFKILFPDAPRPFSAYIDPSLSDSVLAYEEYVTIRGPEILRRTLAASGAVVSWNDTNVKDPDDFLRHILGRGLGAIAKTWAEEAAPAAEEMPNATAVTPSEGDSLEMVSTGGVASASSAFHSSRISSMTDRYSEYAQSYPDEVPWSGHHGPQHNQIPAESFMNLLDEDELDEMQRALSTVHDVNGPAAWQYSTHDRTMGG